MTAQLKLRDMLRTHVAPALRSQGFAGSGQDFGRLINHEWAVINVQRHSYSTAEEVRFTFNLGIACPYVLVEDAIDPEKAPPEVICHWRIRIGSLLPAGQDTWWLVRSDMTALEAQVLGSTLIGHLVGIAIPMLESMADHEALLASYPGPPFDDLAPAAMDVIGPILRAVGPPERFASYLEAIDATPSAMGLYLFGYEQSRRTGAVAASKAIQRLGSGQFEPRVWSLIKLSAATPTEEVIVAVRACLGDANAYIRRAAVVALAKLGDVGSADAMSSMIDDDPARGAACAAAIAVSSLGLPLTEEQRFRTASAIRRRHARAVGHDRPILGGLLGKLEAPV